MSILNGFAAEDSRRSGWEVGADTRDRARSGQAPAIRVGVSLCRCPSGTAGKDP